MPATSTTLARNLHLLEGAASTGVLVSGSHALLFDCDEAVTPDRLAALGVQSVDMILCTQHRRSVIGGLYPFAEQGARIVVSERDRPWFADVDAYWNDPKNRWHIYHFQPGPEVMPRPVPVSRTVRDGDHIDWEGHSIRVLDTPGATDGSVTYLVTIDGTTVAFCGDALHGPGRLLDLYSLQKGHDGFLDYHSFIGNRRALIRSLHKLADSGANTLVPSRGEVMANPRAAIDLTLHRLEAVWRSYTSISALNHIFPQLTADTRTDPDRLPIAPLKPLPPFVRRVALTSFAVISDTGAAFLHDCAGEAVITTLRQWLQEQRIRSVDACWITHYHDDHVDGLRQLLQAFPCPIIADRHMAEILEHPLRFFLPCLSPHSVTVSRKTADRETWAWNEFTMTAFHFPGQTLYGGGLLVEGHGTSVFFCGDSFVASGADDYCAQNRNILRRGQGFRRCLDILRECRPALLVNAHQDMAWTFTSTALTHMDRVLDQREHLLKEFLPWDDPNFGLDEHWCRAYPYEQPAKAGQTITVDIQFTNHSARPAAARVAPALPEDWTWESLDAPGDITVPARTDGFADAFAANPDRSARVAITIPPATTPRLYVIPFRVTWQGRALGPIRHTLVRVVPATC